MRIHDFWLIRYCTYKLLTAIYNLRMNVFQLNNILFTLETNEITALELSLLYINTVRYNKLVYLFVISIYQSLNYEYGDIYIFLKCVLQYER